MRIIRRPLFSRTHRLLTLTVAVSVVALSSVAGWAASPHNPGGGIDSVTSTANGVTVVGGARDPDTAAPIHVNLTSDGTLVAGVIANAALHGGHGFLATLNLAVGTHRVCATALNVGPGANASLGCRTVVVAHDPQGSLDSVTQQGPSAYVVGGAMDPDSPSTKLSVQINVDGTLDQTTVADQPLHGGRGYQVLLTLAQGVHTVCAIGVNVGPGSNKTLGCKTITIDVDPIGGVDSVVQRGADAYVVGSALDLSNAAAKLQVRLTVGGNLAATVTANQAIHHGHGFIAAFPVGNGSQSVCAIGVNIGAGQDTTLGCKSVVFNMSPSGGLDSAVQRGTVIYLVGGASDPNATGPLSVRVLLDGSTVATLTANQAVHHGKGYIGSVPVSTAGAHTVCTVGVNVGPGSDTNLGCKTVLVDFDPFGRLDSAARVGTTGIAVSGWTIDPSNPTTALPVHISVDGVTVKIATANLRRMDIAAAYPGTGTNHGYAATLSVDQNEHRVCVSAMNVGPGNGEVIGCRIVNALHPVAPGTPARVSATAAYGSATVTWNAPTSDGGAPVSAYRISSVPGAATITVPSTVTTAVMSSLKSNTSYTFTVVAVNVAGASTGVRSNAIRTPNTPPPQTSPAPVSSSRYTRNIVGSGAAMLTQMSREGAQDAGRNPSGHSYIVLLDIGGQDESDGGVVLTAGVRFVSYSDLVKNLESYVDGYAHRQNASAPTVIALGTNNDMDTSSSSGASWARNVVNPVQAYAARYSAIKIAGADDMEPGFRASYASTRSWLQGYLGATTAPFVFNGSADGCNWSATNGSCNNGWSAAGLYYLSAGAAPSRMISLPQIYNNTMAAQWKYISLTGVGGNQPRVNFGGPLTEYTACAQAGSCYSLNGHDAWVAMWNQLQSAAALKVSSLPFATDLRIDS